MEEKTFFENGTVKVTSARFIVDGQTFAMSNVTSVNPLMERPSRVLGGFLVLIGAATLTENAFFGVPILALGAYVLYQQRTMYHVMLRTAGGEAKALSTRDREYLDKVVAALNAAIVHRG